MAPPAVLLNLPAFPSHKYHKHVLNVESLVKNMKEEKCLFGMCVCVRARYIPSVSVVLLGISGHIYQHAGAQGSALLLQRGATHSENCFLPTFTTFFCVSCTYIRFRGKQVEVTGSLQLQLNTTSPSTCTRTHAHTGDCIYTQHCSLHQHDTEEGFSSQETEEPKHILQTGATL